MGQSYLHRGNHITRKASLYWDFAHGIITGLKYYFFLEKRETCIKEQLYELFSLSIAVLLYTIRCCIWLRYTEGLP